MRLTTERRALADALKRVTPAAAKTASNPVLLGVRIEASAGQINLCCTDLDVTIDHWVDCTDLTPGNVVVPAHLLNRLVGTLAGESVTIELDDDGGFVTVTCDGTVAQLNTIDGDGWPQFEPIDGDPVKLDATTIDNLRRLTHAASTNTSRPILGCVGFARGHAACTDSHRLVAMPFELADGVEVNVPATMLATAIANTTGDATITFAAREVAWHADGTTTRSRVVDGEFPRWESLVRQTSPSTITLDVDALAGALKRVAVVQGEALAVTITPHGDTCTVQRHAADVGTITENIDVLERTGKPIGFSCNGTYLSDALRNLHPDDTTITLGLVDSLKPVVWTSCDLVNVLMPVRMAAAPATGRKAK